MARKYGNQTGAPNEPNTGVAAGSFISPTEVARQKSIAQGWPTTNRIAQGLVGSYALALTSGALNVAETDDWLHCNGAAISRSTYSELYAIISGMYGNGDGSTTFNLPECTDYVYFKTTTTATTSGVTMSGQARIPEHSHTFTKFSRSNLLGNNPGPSTGVVNEEPTTTVYTSIDGGALNRGRNRQVYPVLCAKSTNIRYPAGCVFPVLLPTDTGSPTPTLSPLIAVCSGQEVSRTACPKLFKAIGTLFGSGNLTTSFNLPDLRGLFLEHVNKSIVTQTSGILPSGYVLDDFASHSHGAVVSYNNTPGNDPTVYAAGTTGDLIPPATTSASVGDGGESRGQNISVLFCVELI